MESFNRAERLLGRCHFWYGCFFILASLGLPISAAAQSCDCPATTTCGACVGGLTGFTLKFNGASPSLITASDQLGVCFSAIVNPGETFSFTGTLPNQKFVGTGVSITVDGVPDVTLSVLCGTPVYALEIHGSFLVVAGQSLTGGSLCCSPTNTETTAPQITGCPAPINATLSPSACTTPVTWTVPAATDNCTLASFTSSHLPGDSFGLGTTTVTYLATDSYGNSSSCSFDVIVSDNTNPTIQNCPTDISIQADGLCGAVATWVTPTALDNCTVTLSGSHTSGATFPLGTTTITYTATDGSGNTTQCSFNVIVEDQELPVLSNCPGNINVEADASCEATVSWTAPNATDNCSVTVTTSHLSGSTFPIGTTPVTYTATDVSGNTSTCSFNVVVVDQQLPVLTNCPGNITVDAGNNCEATVMWTAPAATDNCTVSLTSTHASGSTFPLGTTLVTFTATDGAGNASTCSFNVTVKDQNPPTFTNCPSDITATANATCMAVVSWPSPAFTDLCAVSMTTSHSSGQLFPIGTTQVIYTATDAAGNSSTCSFNVIVRDELPPLIINCPTELVLQANTSCGAVANWTAPTASDNCSVSLSSDHSSGQTFPLGTTRVTYTASDEAGNKTSCSFNVIVRDLSAPVFNLCPFDITVNAGENCNAFVTWQPPNATDACDVSITSSSQPGDLFEIGSTTVSYVAEDPSGNKAICTFTVHVADASPPQLVSFPANIELIAGPSCAAVANWSEPVFDDCSDVVAVASHTNGQSFPLGTTEITYTFTDANQAATVRKFNVTVKDLTPPVFKQFPADIAISTTSCEASVTWVLPLAEDNCGNIFLSSSTTPGSVFPLGVTTVQYTATDESGNATTLPLKISVTNSIAPYWTDCPGDIEIKITTSSSAVVVWQEPKAFTSCGEITTSSNHAAGDEFPVGVTTVEYLAQTTDGQTARCSFNVRVTLEEISFDVPQLITPNGDGSHDTWQLTGLEKFTDNEVAVFDRWGGKIWGAKAYDNKQVVWDGNRDTGGLSPSGTYFFVIRVRRDNEVVDKKGFIELIR